MVTFVSPAAHINRFMDTVGDGSGTKNATGDYAASATEFLFINPGPSIIQLARLLVFIEDTTGFTASKYGNISGGLTNGFNIEVKDPDDTVLVSLTDSVPIKNNAEFGRYCYDVALRTWGAGNEMLNARWTFIKAGAAIFLAPEHKIVIGFTDDLTGLLQHYFKLQGIST